MKTFLKILKWILITVVVIFAGLFAFVQFGWDKTYEAPYPEINASTDSAVIARGRYLAYGPAHCATCHVPMDKILEVENGLEIPLSGGWELTIPPGTFRAPNLTPHEETGIGKLTDGEIARTLRHAVNSENGVVFPFMPFAEMSDDDLTAVISFLRSQEAVEHNMKRSKPSFLGKALMAFGLVKPEGAKGNPPKSVAIDTTVDYGRYMATDISNCLGCHTDRSLKTGEFIGEPFAGGMYMPPDAFSQGRSFVTPNLTPDETGIMTNWSEETFINKMRAGRTEDKAGSPMPWGAFSRMDDVELKAIYRFLQSLDPIENEIKQVIYEKGESPEKEH